MLVFSQQADCFNVLTQLLITAIRPFGTGHFSWHSCAHRWRASWQLFDELFFVCCCAPMYICMWFISNACGVQGTGGVCNHPPRTQEDDHIVGVGGNIPMRSLDSFMCIFWKHAAAAMLAFAKGLAAQRPGQTPEGGGAEESGPHAGGRGGGEADEEVRNPRERARGLANTPTGAMSQGTLDGGLSMHDDGEGEPQGTLEGGLGVHDDSDGEPGLEVREIGEDGSAAPCGDGEASDLGMESGEQCSDCVGTATTIEAIFCA